MAVAFKMKFEGATLEQYDRVMELMGLDQGDTSPEGQRGAGPVRPRGGTRRLASGIQGPHLGDAQADQPGHRDGEDGEQRQRDCRLGRDGAGFLTSVHGFLLTG